MDSDILKSVEHDTARAKAEVSVVKETLWREFVKHNGINYYTRDELNTVEMQLMRKAFDVGWWGMAQMSAGMIIALKGALEMPTEEIKLDRRA